MIMIFKGKITVALETTTPKKRKLWKIPVKLRSIHSRKNSLIILPAFSLYKVNIAWKLILCNLLMMKSDACSVNEFLNNLHVLPCVQMNEWLTLILICNERVRRVTYEKNEKKCSKIIFCKYFIIGRQCKLLTNVNRWNI